jgi:hypothetical protein
MEKCKYYSFQFPNGECYHIKEKDVDRLINERGCKILTWEDYKPFAVKVASDAFDYSLENVKITIKEVKLTN